MAKMVLTYKVRQDWNVEELLKKYQICESPLYFLHLPEMWEYVRVPKGLVECHKCGFKSDRQFVGAFNVFVRGLGATVSGVKGRTFTHIPP